ncbi:hypothetical protein PLICRDRAFT_45673 [Plicaturopsis crispa FD-325 SS-3]|uniref:Unplaced genomic scaffold PLICRscaffold_16, whole genome shotgun sequence n=1 Tax=Plicaturopsis crispa FD-325 SS-3 TaxID=944288 RepID=A0A0C9T689_PLICR|nr:hypothetical protein PLICRDRAFT_45673 [Plicaturopsis crispa FD-325 SS-3]
MYALLALAQVTLFASQVAAVAVGGSPIDGLLRRQSTTLDPSSFPAACQTTCTSIINTLNSCTTLACLCTNANGQALEGCLDCTANTAPTSAVITQAQTVLDQFTEECSQGGVSLSSLTIAVSTGAVSASGTASASASASASAAATSVLATPSSALVTFASSASAAGVSFSSSTAAAGSSSSSSSSAVNPLATNGARRISAGVSFGAVAAVLAGAAVVL